MNLLVALLLLSFLILVHELGHFLVAKKCGIRVLEFSMFMGPKLFSFKKGETQYSLRLIPMGGYVKMEGEESASADPRAYGSQKIWKRVLVIAAGPFMNIVLAFLLISIYIMSVGVMTNQVSQLGENSPFLKAGMNAGDRLVSWNGTRMFDLRTDLTMLMHVAGEDAVDIVWEDEAGVRREAEIVLPMTVPTYRLGFTAAAEGEVASNIIDFVEQDSPLQRAGIRQGDRIVGMDGTEVSNRDDIVEYLNFGRPAGNPPVDITVDRNGEALVFNDIAPFMDSHVTLYTEFAHEKPGIFGSIASAWRYSVSTIRMVLTTLGWLFTGDISFQEVSGPVGIVGAIGSVVEREPTFGEKVLSLFSLGALLSLNLGVMNLIPFPALDGSKLVLLGLEKIRKKPLPPEKEGFISLIGFSLLVLLLVVTLFNDIQRWIL